jgi:hypothetical protein
MGAAKLPLLPLARCWEAAGSHGDKEEPMKAKFETVEEALGRGVKVKRLPPRDLDDIDLSLFHGKEKVRAQLWRKRTEQKEFVRTMDKPPLDGGE